MSFCPTKDIHSVYLDNELPDVYKAEYEKHLSECEKCRSELASLKAVRDVFQADVASMTPDKQFLDDSYQRLMIKMSYERNSKKIKKPLFFKIGSAVSAAAAAVLFAVFIPMGLNSKKSSLSEVDVPPVMNRMFSMDQFGNNISFGSGNNMALSGNMDGGILSSNNYINYMDYGSLNYGGFSNINYGGENSNYIGIDFFDYIDGNGMLRPQLVNEDDIISIRVTIPSVSDVPISLDNMQQGVVLSGNYLWNLLEN